MKHRLFYTLGPIVLVMVAFTISPAQVQQVQPVQLAVPYKQPLKIYQAMTAVDARKAQPIYDSGWTRQIGVSNGSYNLNTSEVWATSIDDGKFMSSTHGAAGFQTSGIQNTGELSLEGCYCHSNNTSTITITLRCPYDFSLLPITALCERGSQYWPGTICKRVDWYI